MATDPISIAIIDRLHSFGVTAHGLNSYGLAHLLMQSKTIELAL